VREGCSRGGGATGRPGRGHAYHTTALQTRCSSTHTHRRPYTHKPGARAHLLSLLCSSTPPKPLSPPLSSLSLARARALARSLPFSCLSHCHSPSSSPSRPLSLSRGRRQGRGTRRPSSLSLSPCRPHRLRVLPLAHIPPRCPTLRSSIRAFFPYARVFQPVKRGREGEGGCAGPPARLGPGRAAPIPPACSGRLGRGPAARAEREGAWSGRTAHTGPGPSGVLLAAREA
jgi:hypothetical protein